MNTLPHGVTVLVPAYNAMPYLSACIESVLIQGLESLELLVINDGSNDETADYLATIDDPRLSVVHRANEGLVATLNQGLHIARFDWIARLDADDVMRRDRLSRQLAFLKANPEYRVVASDYGYIDTKGRILSIRKRLTLSAPPAFDPTIDGNIPHQGVLYNRTDILAVGGYRDLVPAEDLDLWLRLRNRVRFAVIPEPLTYVRILPGSISDRQYFEQRRMWSYVKECARKRDAGMSEPAFDCWLIANKATIAKKRRSWVAGHHIRQAGISLAAGKPLATIGHGFLGLWWGPSEVIGKLLDYRPNKEVR